MDCKSCREPWSLTTWKEVGSCCYYWDLYNGRRQKCKQLCSQRNLDVYFVIFEIPIQSLIVIDVIIIDTMFQRSNPWPSSGVDFGHLMCSSLCCFCPCDAGSYSFWLNQRILFHYLIQILNSRQLSWHQNLTN